MKKPTKKQGILMAGAAVIICGCFWMLMPDHKDEKSIPGTNAAVIHDIRPIIEKATKEKELEEKQEKEKPQKAEAKKETEQTSTQEPSKEVVQSIAPEPEVPQEETIQAPPVQEPTEDTSSNAGNAENHDGMVWIDGFGWIEDEGGGGEVIEAPDMIPNGNQIGEMN